MWPKTGAQSPGAGWRNSRAVGYHGLSSRPSSQRQSGVWCSATQTGAAQPARQVGHGRVHAHHQIEIHDQGGRVLESASRPVHEIAEVRDGEAPGEGAQLLRAGVLLQADQADARRGGERLEECQGDGAMAVPGVPRAALPGDADLEAGHDGKLSPPVFDPRRVGEEIRRAGGDRLQGGV